MSKWKKYQETMKKKGNLENIPFPYKFIDHKDVLLHPVWKIIMSDLEEKIKTVDASEIRTYIEVCYFMRDTFGYIPLTIFECVV